MSKTRPPTTMVLYGELCLSTCVLDAGGRIVGCYALQEAELPFSAEKRDVWIPKSAMSCFDIIKCCSLCKHFFRKSLGAYRGKLSLGQQIQFRFTFWGQFLLSYNFGLECLFFYRLQRMVAMCLGCTRTLVSLHSEPCMVEKPNRL